MQKKQLSVKQLAFSALLVFVSLVSFSTPLVLNSGVIFGVQVPDFANFYHGHYWQSPTTTYYAIQVPQVRINGTYHTIYDSEETVFYLTMKSGKRVQLIFYCNEPTWREVSTGFVKGWAYASETSQVPFKDGQFVILEGTLIVPSRWNPALSEHHLEFVADFYVFSV
jgi:hypothetical protein